MIVAWARDVGVALLYTRMRFRLVDTTVKPWVTVVDLGRNLTVATSAYERTVRGTRGDLALEVVEPARIDAPADAAK